MKNLYKKICVVALSSVILAGGALVSNSSISHAYSFEQDVQSVIQMGPYFCQFLGKNYRGLIIGIVSDAWDLLELLDSGLAGGGVYKIGGYFFRISV